MNAKFPDDKTIREVLTLAARAPSVHNSQPWRWHVGERSLDLHCVPTLHLRATDPDRRDLILSCGAALHHGVVALAAMGWRAEVHRFPNPVDANHVATIEVQRQGCGDLDVKLAAAIPRRRTDRRLYSPWPVPDGDVAATGDPRCGGRGDGAAGRRPCQAACDCGEGRPAALNRPRLSHRVDHVERAARLGRRCSRTKYAKPRPDRDDTGAALRRSRVGAAPRCDRRRGSRRRVGLRYGR